MKNTMRKLNAIAHKANAMQIVRDLKLMIKINEKIIKTFVNSKVISNFIFQFIVNKYKFNIIKFKNSQYLLMINENKLKTTIIKETIFLFILIQQYHEKITFEVVQIITYDFVLNMF